MQVWPSPKGLALQPAGTKVALHGATVGVGVRRASVWLCEQASLAAAGDSTVIQRSSHGWNGSRQGTGLVLRHPGAVGLPIAYRPDAPALPLRWRFRVVRGLGPPALRCRHGPTALPCGRERRRPNVLLGGRRRTAVLGGRSHGPALSLGRPLPRATCARSNGRLGARLRPHRARKPGSGPVTGRRGNGGRRKRALLTHHGLGTAFAARAIASDAGNVGERGTALGRRVDAGVRAPLLPHHRGAGG